jgi:hypothetical protein
VGSNRAAAAAVPVRFALMGPLMSIDGRVLEQRVARRDDEVGILLPIHATGVPVGPGAPEVVDHVVVVSLDVHGRVLQEVLEVGVRAVVASVLPVDVADLRQVGPVHGGVRDIGEIGRHVQPPLRPLDGKGALPRPG